MFDPQMVYGIAFGVTIGVVFITVNNGILFMRGKK
jgi:hypothetical protein